jgi:hypothetical protein
MKSESVDSASKRHNVFYSWQSDLPQSLNRGVINKALEAAKKKLKQGTLGIKVELASRAAGGGEESNLDVNIDQATQGLPGSPKIADAIIAKISAADVFVADISVINATSKNFRHTPNPNVIFELGYAAAVLGWERIILVINDAGKKKVQVPFDIQGHRYLSYSLTEKTEDRTAVVDRLGHSLASAIRTIIASKPPRPSELRGKTAQQLRREHDVRALTTIFSSISIPVLQEHLQSAPDQYKYATSLVVDEFDAIYRSFNFRVHDPQLREILKKFNLALHQSVPGSGLSFYRETGDPCTERFASYGEIAAQNALDAAAKVRKRLEAGLNMLAQALEQMLAYVHDSYPEVNVEELGRALGREIAAQLREIRSAAR